MQIVNDVPFLYTRKKQQLLAYFFVQIQHLLINSPSAPGKALRSDRKKWCVRILLWLETPKHNLMRPLTKHQAACKGGQRKSAPPSTVICDSKCSKAQRERSGCCKLDKTPKETGGVFARFDEARAGKKQQPEKAKC